MGLVAIVSAPIAQLHRHREQLGARRPRDPRRIGAGLAHRQRGLEHVGAAEVAAAALGEPPELLQLLGDVRPARSSAASSGPGR
jgi:hypothetical protein